MLGDVARLRRRLHAIEIAKRDRRLDHIPKLESEFRRELFTSIDRREHRANTVPKPKFDQDLPIVHKRDEIMKAIAENQVVIVCGETGSGKTTQIPQMCLTLGRGIAGFIGHTQPRRIAARSVANRIAEEIGEAAPSEGRNGNSSVGFKVRFGDQSGPGTFIKIMTDGILLAETQSDPHLDHYDTIIIDEAHERSLNIDFLLGYLHQLLPKRKDLKVIITSATIDPGRFAKHFSKANIPAPVIEVSGRTYPVAIRYRPPEDSDDIEVIEDAIIKACDELIAEAPGADDGRHDILVFLPTERDIRNAADELEKHYKKLQHRVEVLPLFARLSTSDQMRVFKQHGGRRIVLATNVAETSLTVPGIRYVVDTGTARISRYTHRTKVERLPIEPISRSSADQRSGRCGRVAEGVCIRLYSEKDYQVRPRFTDPEIRRANLASVILRMKALNLGDVEQFPFIEPPEPRMIRDGFDTLWELGALSHEEHGLANLTRIGRALARLPIDPRISRMILAADTEHSLSEVLVLAAALSVQDPRERPLDKQQDADAAHARFAHETSDFLSLLNLWNFFEKQSQQLTGGKLRRMCSGMFISWVRMREWQDIHRQLVEMTLELKLRTNPRPAHSDAIHRALMTGLLSSLGVKGETHEYSGARHMKFQIHPGSGLFKKNPKWIMAAEIVHTTRMYARNVAKIDPNWIEPLAQHVLKHSYTNVHWTRDVGQIAAFEKVTLFGLEIVPKRRVHFGPIEPKETRALFIHHALVEAELLPETEADPPFLKHNRALVRSVRDLESKGRSHDILADNDAIFAFYDSRVPADVHSTAQFEKWRKEAERKNSKILFMTTDHIMKRTASEISETAFPSSLNLGGAKLPLDYKFAPGEIDDGLTLKVPVEALGQVDEDHAQWLVPGRLEEKITALLRTLPKAVRKDLDPLGPLAAEAAKTLKFGVGSLEDALAKFAHEKKRVNVTRDMFRSKEVPDHLKMNLIVLGEDGKEIARGRDASQLRADLAPQIKAAFAKLAKAGFDRDGIKTWDVGDLPKETQFTRAGSSVVGYPALADMGTSVSLRLLDSAKAAELVHRTGARRLFYLASRDEIVYQSRLISTLSKMTMQFAEFGSPEELKNDLQLLIADRAFMGDDKAPRQQADFEVSLKLGRKKLPAAASEVSKVVSEILQMRHNVALAISGKPPAGWAQPMADIQQQVAFLTPKGFLLATPWERLKHLARYLNGIHFRIHKLGLTGLQRDQKWMYEVLPHWHRYVQKITAQPHLQAQLYDYRWMVEEFRVSLFAQELGTSGPVSAKRLDDLWSKLS